MLTLYVVVDAMIMMAAFLGAHRWPRYRVLLITVGTLAVVAPLLGLGFVVVFFILALRGGNLHFG